MFTILLVEAYTFVQLHVRILYTVRTECAFTQVSTYLADVVVHFLHLRSDLPVC